jgi:hypothetical protein
MIGTDEVGDFTIVGVIPPELVERLSRQLFDLEGCGFDYRGNRTARNRSDPRSRSYRCSGELDEAVGGEVNDHGGHPR